MIFLYIAGAIAVAVVGFIIWRYLATVQGQRKLIIGLLEKVAPVSDALDSNKEPDALVVHQLANDPVTRCALYDTLLTHHRLDLFPDELLTWPAIAEADMVFWLSHPNELETPPDEIELAGKVSKRFPNLPTNLHYFVFKFRVDPPHWAAKNGWMAGVAGPYNLKTKPMPGGSGTFSRLEPFDSRSLKEHVEFSHNIATENG